MKSKTGCEIKNFVELSKKLTESQNLYVRGVIDGIILQQDFMAKTELLNPEQSTA
ncbi:hypothetical protein AGMMS49975_28550 [Clostridia bacterium]|nr:hypothetical protein AGMMS49975_28550 [Clostridia bacterium]